MPVNAAQLRQHYVSLSDEELLAIDPNDLTEVAKNCYESEIQRRGISVTQPSAPTEDKPATAPEWEQAGSGGESDDGDTFVACTFTDIRGSSATDAEEAYRLLKAAGIPCRIEVHPIEESSSVEHRVVVPSAYILHATSVLDRDYFNPRLESDWKTHLESLTNEQFFRLNVDDICAGLLDRAARLRNAYLEERSRRP